MPTLTIKKIFVYSCTGCLLFFHSLPILSQKNSIEDLETYSFITNKLNEYKGSLNAIKERDAMKSVALSYFIDGPIQIYNEFIKGKTSVKKYVNDVRDHKDKVFYIFKYHFKKPYKEKRKNIYKCNLFIDRTVRMGNQNEKDLLFLRVQFKGKKNHNEFKIEIIDKVDNIPEGLSHFSDINSDISTIVQEQARTKWSDFSFDLIETKSKQLVEEYKSEILDLKKGKSGKKILIASINEKFKNKERTYIENDLKVNISSREKVINYLSEVQSKKTQFDYLSKPQVILKNAKSKNKSNLVVIQRKLIGDNTFIDNSFNVSFTKSRLYITDITNKRVEQELAPEEAQNASKNARKLIESYIESLKELTQNENQIQGIINTYFLKGAKIQPDIQMSLNKDKEFVDCIDYINALSQINVEQQFDIVKVLDTQFNPETDLFYTNVDVRVKSKIASEGIPTYVTGIFTFVVQYKKGGNDDLINKIGEVYFKETVLKNTDIISKVELFKYLQGQLSKKAMYPKLLNTEFETNYDIENMEIAAYIPELVGIKLFQTKENIKTTLRIEENSIELLLKKNIFGFNFKLGIQINKDNVQIAKDFPLPTKTKKYVAMPLSKFIGEVKLPQIGFQELSQLLLGVPIFEEDSLWKTTEDDNFYFIENIYKKIKIKYIVDKESLSLNEMTLHFASDDISASLVFKDYVQLGAENKFFPNYMKFELNSTSTAIPRNISFQKMNLVDEIYNDEKFPKNQFSISKNFEQVSWDDFIEEW